MTQKLQNMFAITKQGAIGVQRAAFWSFLKFLSSMLPMIILMLFTQDKLTGNARTSIFYWALIAVAFTIMFVINFVTYNSTYTNTYKECADLRIDIINMLKDLTLSYFSRHNLSDMSQTVMKDVSDIEMSLSHAIPQFIGFVVYFIVMSTMMIIGNLKLGLAIILPILISFIILIISKKTQVKGSTLYYAQLREMSDILQETIELESEIRSYNQVEKVKQNIFEKAKHSENVHIKAELIMSIMMNLSVAILKIIVGIAISMGTILLINKEIDILYFVGYMLAAVKIADSIEGVYEFLPMMYFFDASYDRIRQLRSQEIQKGKYVDIKKFDIELKNVNFSYGNNEVIKDVSFVAKQNEVTALVGPSGCGKTTILRLISRLYDYESGKIIIDDHDIKDISTTALFDKISIVFQNVELFNTSIMENIRLGKKTATDEEVIRAAKLANVDEFVSKMPDGYNTMIGENGSKLSGGQRQRISIARAILKDAPIIILDEISASIDVENEMKIQEGLNRLIKNKTVIIISHRLKSVENVNKIVVMNAGTVDSIGTHSELLQKSKLYKNMVEKSMMTENYMY